MIFFAGAHYYFWEGYDASHWPTHDPCGLKPAESKDRSQQSLRRHLCEINSTISLLTAASGEFRNNQPSMAKKRDRGPSEEKPSKFVYISVLLIIFPLCK